eukprot:GHVT01082610.1.p1 GENE.GHVT01082610.1~~GHVT01082610.1.p1  ORF type:complete len:572 (-),score=58.63 GHVT01082610.1:1105-2820(-)
MSVDGQDQVQTVPVGHPSRLSDLPSVPSALGRLGRRIARTIQQMRTSFNALVNRKRVAGSAKVKNTRTAHVKERRSVWDRYSRRVPELSRLLDIGGEAFLVRYDEHTVAKVMPGKYIRNEMSAHDVRKLLQITHILAVAPPHPSLMRLLTPPALLDRLTGDVFFLVEYIDGQNLAQWTTEYFDQPLARMQLLQRIAPQVVETVRYMHSLNLAHIDIKPQNIMITRKSSLPYDDTHDCRTNPMCTCNKKHQVAGRPDETEGCCCRTPLHQSCPLSGAAPRQVGRSCGCNTCHLWHYDPNHTFGDVVAKLVDFGFTTDEQMDEWSAVFTGLRTLAPEIDRLVRRQELRTRIHKAQRRGANWMDIEDMRFELHKLQNQRLDAEDGMPVVSDEHGSGLYDPTGDAAKLVNISDKLAVPLPSNIDETDDAMDTVDRAVRRRVDSSETEASETDRQGGSHSGSDTHLTTRKTPGTGDKGVTPDLINTKLVDWWQLAYSFRLLMGSKNFEDPKYQQVAKTLDAILLAPPSNRFKAFCRFLVLLEQLSLPSKAQSEGDIPKVAEKKSRVILFDSGSNLF